MAIQVDLGEVAERRLVRGVEHRPDADAAPTRFNIDIDELLATRALVQGNSGSGKSHLLRRLMEGSARHVQQIIIDPEGDFTSLATVYGHLVIDAARSDRDLIAIATRVRERRVSCVLNLDQLEVEQQMRAAAIFNNALFDADRDFWFPALVFVDEVQLFAPAVPGEVSSEVNRMSLGSMTNLMCRGRKRGLCGIIATQRLAKLAKNVAAEASNFLMGRTFLDIDMQRAADLLGIDRGKAEMFRDLQRGHFIALGPALSRSATSIIVGPVETAPRGATPKLTPPPKAEEVSAEEMLAPADGVFARPIRPLRTAEPGSSTEEVLAAADRETPAHIREDDSQAIVMDDAEREAALRTVIAEIMTASGATYRKEAELYQEFCVALRVRKIGGKRPDLSEFRGYLTVARAGVGGDMAATADWGKAMETAAQAPEALRSIYLLFARAALDKSPCPSDLDVARISGSHSPRLARSRIEKLEAEHFLVVRKARGGTRVVVLPDFNWETAPGDPAAPAREPANATA